VQINFKGNLEQIPPMYSALKKEGVPLYEIARRGETVERQSRAIKIHELTLQKMDTHHIHFKVFCSKGTYVRTLAEDIAKALGCCAHLVALRRTSVGKLQGPMITLEKLMESYRQQISADEFLLPMDALLVDLPKIALEKSNCQALLQGKKILYPQAEYLNGCVSLYTEEGKFFGVGSMDAGCYLKPERLVSSDYFNELA
jgi:tRNA pseudouridine55 synthase